MIGENLSLILYFVNIEKANKPRSGPYVYEAKLNSRSIILSLPTK